MYTIIFGLTFQPVVQSKFIGVLFAGLAVNFVYSPTIFYFDYIDMNSSAQPSLSKVSR
jgi:hypothetical protein